LAFETIFYSAASKPVFLNLEKVIFTPALQPGDSESIRGKQALAVKII